MSFDSRLKHIVIASGGHSCRQYTVDLAVASCRDGTDRIAVTTRDRLEAVASQTWSCRRSDTETYGHSVDVLLRTLDAVRALRGVPVDLGIPMLDARDL